MRIFNHRIEKRAQPSVASNGSESQEPERKKERGCNKLHMPRNGQIAILPEGDHQFKYVHYSPDDKIKKGLILGVILKQEYPSIIDGTNRAGRPIQFQASKWCHYSKIVRDDNQTAADRVEAKFWVSIKWHHCSFMNKPWATLIFYDCSFFRAYIRCLKNL
uniref:Uncharacterized protein n=1 Tax=Arundo donax TaxID=35708 RepID=A0A0A9DMT5_ARUDO